MHIELFIREWCPWCVEARAILDQRGYSYTVRDLENDPANVAEMIRISGQRKVPTLTVGSLVLADFGPEELLAFLKKYGLQPDSKTL